mmetsp:Transcript_27494/g.78684  ORF Transcript_27494/g.78684 Transcript_27494/m.78684 type:complete len:295 (+) Transcript_27494:50-934(+)
MAFTGTVVNFNNMKERGLIDCVEDQIFYFDHKSGITDGQALVQGNKVRFEVVFNERNDQPQAENVSGGTGGVMSSMQGGEHGNHRGGKGGSSGNWGGGGRDGGYSMYGGGKGSSLGCSGGKGKPSRGTGGGVSSMQGGGHETHNDMEGGGHGSCNSGKGGPKVSWGVGSRGGSGTYGGGKSSSDGYSGGNPLRDILDDFSSTRPVSSVATSDVSIDPTEHCKDRGEASREEDDYLPNPYTYDPYLRRMVHDDDPFDYSHKDGRYAARCAGLNWGSGSSNSDADLDDDSSESDVD